MLLGMMTTYWRQCNEIPCRGKMLKVQFGFRKFNFSVYIKNSLDEEFMRFLAIVKESCVAPDGCLREWCREEVLKERKRWPTNADLKRHQEEDYPNSSVRAMGRLAQMMAQRPPSKKRRKNEHRIGGVMAQGISLSNNKFQIEGTTLEEAVRDNDDRDESDSDEEACIVGDPEAASSRGGSPNV